MVSKRWLEEAELHCAAAQSLQEEKEASRSQAIAHAAAQSQAIADRANSAKEKK